ncbi:MAG: tRNA 5-methoxyuridine(34)/uridine 5-oxyacetic acid(34) synthase CmoB [Woeseiaceae bacterium]|nr:tRNA 5-methoxyuridine(34)/uridine 5-oxyacetic acid(34) synthase CmoB [Woeseiaceae bacterium]
MAILDIEAAFSELDRIGLSAWRQKLVDRVRARLDPSAHGDLPRWQAAIDALPRPTVGAWRLDEAAIATGELGWSADERETARAALLALKPWRKGPFEIDRITVDSEWRSDLKWSRVATAVSPLDGRSILDVGCGNGYYALRMHGAGAARVIGVDPTLVHLAQFAAVSRFLPALPVHLLPLRLEELPPGARSFDTTFSMGVLYHSRSPIGQLRRLRDTLRPGGELVLETLVLPGEDAYSKTPRQRYARMRNVWHLPSVPELKVWLARVGFEDARLAGVTTTTGEEQRSTEWMPFESLAEALDPGDPASTVEGWPAPRRAVLVASAPGRQRTHT